MNATPSRHLGSVYTPPDFAQFLTSWAIRGPSDQALDVGVGDGVFVYNAYRRLLHLGAHPAAAQRQIFGAEIDADAYDSFQSRANQNGLCFPNVHRQDFFTLELPEVDAVIGNPPYVRRIHIRDVTPIRERVLKIHQQIKEADLSRLTDLYVYFLMVALARLKPGGRCAVITADPWLAMGYGGVLKKYLKNNFHIDCLITLDRRVFASADVKPVMMLATKLPDATQNHGLKPTYFVRIKNGLAISVIEQSVRDKNFNLPDVKHTAIDHATLAPEHPWSIYFRAPDTYDELANHALMTPMSNLAETRIGIQTLAKDFFVLSTERAANAGLEPEYLAPLAQSPRFFNQPVIHPGSHTDYYLFYCSKSKAELTNTKTLKYILAGETREVEVRGKEGITVIGYHNKERIQRSHRKQWYDLRTALERRGRASILIPRLIYKSYTVVWNQARCVPGELFIEFLPAPLFAVDDEVYLAILTSSVTEVMLRVNAQVYGGGTYNINPGQVKKVPIINVNILTDAQRARLKRAYRLFLKSPAHDRAPIDRAVFAILGLTSAQQQVVKQTLVDLLVIATSSKKAHSASP